MPLAEDTAATSLPALSQPAELGELVTAICEAPRPAHAPGWIHRDLKPENLLRLDGIWTVADWGLTRRPWGQTTDPDRTRAGTMFGTEGFAAPELSADAHNAGPQADIYSIGQIIGWALRGQMPQANTPLSPASGPWRQVARAATQLGPARRPATVDALLEIMRDELDYEQPDDSDTAGQLRAPRTPGDETAAAQLFSLAARCPDDIRSYTEVLSGLTQDAVRAGVDGDTQLAAEVARAMSGHVRSSGLSVDDAARIITRLHWTSCPVWTLMACRVL